jgi:ABC-type glycerol-3-phosphate transport system substrate-binding protein
MLHALYRPLGVLLAAGLLLVVVWRAGMTRAWVASLDEATPRAVQLRVWDWWSPSGNEEYGAYFDEVKATFEKRHPGIEIVYQVVPFGTYVQKLATAMVGQSPPDVFQSSVYWAEGFYQRGMLRPLNDLLARDGVHDDGSRITEEAFLPSAWRHNHTEDGVVYGIPQIIDATCLLWNLDILQAEAAHDEAIRDLFVRRSSGEVDYDRIRFDAIRDWDHFRRIAKKLTRYGPDGEVMRSGFMIHAYGGGAGMFSPWLSANGGRYQDPAGTRAEFAGPAGVEAMTFMAGLYWQDRVCLPFRRQLSDAEQFQEGNVACIVAGTWSGKDIMRNTLGWQHLGKTAFPPGPAGRDQKTNTWGNMLVITRRTPHVEAAWKYIKFVCSLEGNLLRLKHLRYNGPRRDFYDTPEWQAAMIERPYLSNVKQICLAGDKLRHTEIIAIDHQVNPVVETILLRYPDIVAGRGPYPSVEMALQEAARNANNVFARYNRQVSQWLAR